ncbi:MAG: hypothetical protein C4536_02370 [Actinobacteria bacterium]|jgi:hypothetical protein|nr:MAG: hypothetical protein C4536_02370 [Actinomycetota bacterium]
MKAKSAWKDPYLYLAVLFNIAVHHVWFFSTAIMTHGDSGFSFPEQIGQVASFQTWSAAGLGGVVTMPSSYPYIFLAGLFARAGLSMAVIQRIVLFWPAIIVGSIGSYLLVRKVSESSLGGLVGSLVFNFNTFFIISTSGHITIAAAIAWSPLALYLFMELTEEPSLKKAIGCAIPLFIISVLEFRVFYVVCLPILLLYLFSIPGRGEKRGLPSFTALFFLPVIATMLLNAYWLIPYYAGGLEGGLEGIIVGRSLFTGGTTGTNALHSALTVFAPMWSGGKLVTFSTHPIPLYWFLLPIAAFSTLLFSKLRKDKRVLFFAVVALVGVFLTKFIYPPFPGVYEWLYENFPGFSAFREPSKFTFLIYLPYAALLGCLVGHLQRRASARRWKTAGVYLLAALISLPFVLNALPVASGSAGTLFVGRDIPGDYEVYKDFILDQARYSRTLWVPTYSRWSFYNDEHPMVSCVDAVQGAWKELQPPERDDVFKPENIIYILQRPFTQELLRSASIEYVAVPLQDEENDDDFFAYYGGDRGFFIDALDDLEYLERLDIGTGELAVYRNHEFAPEAFATASLCRLDAYGDIDSQYLLARGIQGGDLPFTLNGDPPIGIHIEDLLAADEETTIQDERILEVPAAAEGEKRAFYADRGRGELRCLLTGDEAVFKRQSVGTLLQDGLVLDGSMQQEEILQVLRLDPDAELWMDVDGVWMRLEQGKEINLGEMSRISSIWVWEAEQANLIPNGSFEEGLWQEGVTDCSADGDEPVLAMELTREDASDAMYSLQLEASGGIAGTRMSFSVQGGQAYCLSFDYRGPDAEIAGYSLHFNDEAETILSRQLPVVGNGWISYQRGLEVPRGASVATLYLYSYGDKDRDHAVNRYDNCRLRKLDYADGLDIMEFRNRLEEIAIEDPEGELDFEFVARESKGPNLITNPSFEEGLWGDEVTDCDVYDDRPVLAMALDEEEATQGDYSLRLEATRHIAGAYAVFPVEENQDYRLGFDYQSPNSREAGFSLHFNDEAQTVISERLPISGTEWQHLERSITTPLSATTAVLYVYAYESDGLTTMVNRYDDFSFFKVTPGIGCYYAVSMEEGDTEPVVTGVSDQGSTRKTVGVRSDGGPFILALSQQFDPGWKATRATLENPDGAIANLMTAPVISGNDEDIEVYHFQVDGNLNAWYVACPRQGEAVVEQNDEKADLRYDLTLEFTPQNKVRWGSAITWATALAILLYVIYIAVRSGMRWIRRRRRAGEVPP